MSVWPCVRLGDVCEVNPRLNLTGLAEDTPVTFVSMSAVDEINARIVQPEQRLYRDVRKGYPPFQDNDVLFAKITPCMQNGKAAIASHLSNGLGFGSTEFHVIRPGPSVLAKWVLAFIRQPTFKTTAQASFTGSAGQQRVPADFVKNTLLPVPSLPEQERIVRLLDEADELRRLRTQADRRTAALVPAIFHDMFGDPASNPKGWRVVPLGDLIASGPQNGLYKHTSAYGSGTPILRIDGFYDGAITNKKTLRRLQVTEEEKQQYGLQVGDIVINRVNSIEYLGKSGLIERLTEETVYESNMMRFSVREELDATYLTQFLQTPHAKQHILSRAKHSINQSSINQGDVKSLPVPMPPLALQQEFASRVAQVRAMEAEQAASRERLEALFQATLHRAFRGEL